VGTRLLGFISIVQSIIFLGHLFLYVTLVSFFGPGIATPSLKMALAILSISFVVASLRGWYAHDPLARAVYVVAAVWLGISSYLLWASLLCWIVYGFSRLLHLGWAAHTIGTVMYGLALLVSLYGLINASWLRVVHVPVTLPNLPEQWRGRVAALVSDLHLGHVRNGRFIRRVTRKLRELQPNMVLLAGDMYDGVAADFEKLAEPWAEFLDWARNGGSFEGVFYIQGNHEEFYSHAEYLPPIRRAGVRVLNNEMVDLKGLQLAGVHYRDAVNPESFREILRGLRLDRERPSILMLHAPVRLPISEEEGVSLQVSGHTHGGQFFPYTWIAQKVWSKFIYGLQQFGKLQVYTSYGAGTWGPPMRVGTRPEIVLINFV
jgi:predicted MPP superfamily phosphohydrolase